MADPLRPLDKPAPRRAEPLQPDNPTTGGEAERSENDASERGEKSLKRAEEQSRTARDNVERKS